MWSFAGCMMQSCTTLWRIGSIEWELSLYQALKQLGYTVQADPERFMLRDGQGRPRYFSADGFRNSERSLMKLLFPLN